MCMCVFKVIKYACVHGELTWVTVSLRAHERELRFPENEEALHQKKNNKKK